MITSTTPLTADEVRHRVNELLERHFSLKQRQADAISPDYGRLWRTMAATATAGKRLRPYLVYLGYMINGGQNDNEALATGCAVELLHLCMLAHDDIIDRDFVRHGTPNIAGAYQLHYQAALTDPVELDHFANAAALLAGDLLLSDACRLFLRATAGHANAERLAGLLDMAVFTVAGGELLDDEAPLRPIGQSDSLLIAEYKTAYYSCAIPLAIGAVLAGSGEETERRYLAIGKYLGIAYQLTDDLLGVFGDEAHTGKSNMGDLRQAKRTYLLQQTYLLANDEQRRTIDDILTNHRYDDSRLHDIKRIMTASGARSATAALRDEYTAQALDIVDDVKTDTPRAAELEVLISRLVDRDT